MHNEQTEQLSTNVLSDDERRELHDCLTRMLSKLALVKEELRILRRYEGRVLGIARCISLVEWLVTALGHQRGSAPRSHSNDLTSVSDRD